MRLQIMIEFSKIKISFLNDILKSIYRPEKILELVYLGGTSQHDLEDFFEKRKNFSQNWLIFGTRGFSGTKNRLRASKNSEKIFRGVKNPQK